MYLTKFSFSIFKNIHIYIFISCFLTISINPKLVTAQDTTDDVKFQSEFSKFLEESKNDTLDALSLMFKKSKNDDNKNRSVKNLINREMKGFIMLIKIYNETYSYNPETARSFILYDIGNWDYKKDREIIEKIIYLSKNKYPTNEMYSYITSELTINRNKYNNYTIGFFISLLGDSKYSDAKTALIETLYKEKNDDIKVKIIKSLGDLKTVEACPMLRELTTYKKPKVRAACVYNLAKIEENKASDVLFKAAGDKDKNVRKSVKEALVFINDLELVNQINNKLNKK